MFCSVCRVEFQIESGIRSLLEIVLSKIEFTTKSYSSSRPVMMYSMCFSYSNGWPTTISSSRVCILTTYYVIFYFAVPSNGKSQARVHDICPGLGLERHLSGALRFRWRFFVYYHLHHDILGHKEKKIIDDLLVCGKLVFILWIVDLDCLVVGIIGLNLDIGLLAGEKRSPRCTKWGDSFYQICR